ncbi:cupredoxin domain-containing protein [Patescibacteria group bacterium]|nr:cupredoxin domain-containing protein [Patescibacteria group bacterium]
MKRAFTLLALLAGVGLIFFGYQYFSPAPAAPRAEMQSSAEIPAGAIVVTLSKDGYSPDTLSVKVGDTVAFRSVAGELFWPASNLHPSHLVYPEFDPQEPVQSNDVWSFTFTKPGEWKYHDHLAPYYTGVITVTE